MASHDASGDGTPHGDGPHGEGPRGGRRWFGVGGQHGAEKRGGAGQPGDPVTVTVARRVAPGCEQDFEEWAAGILAEARRFPGFLGGGVLRPGSAGHDWHIVYRFADNAAQARWERSPERAGWLAAADGFADLRGQRMVTGLETWFALPGRTAPAPPRWKMAVVTLTGVFPLALLFNVAVLPVLTGLWLPLRVAALAMTLVSLLTWVVMPTLTRLFSGWLYPRARDVLPPPESGPAAPGADHGT